MPPNEATALLGEDHDAVKTRREESWIARAWTPTNRLLLTCLLITFSLSVNQVSQFFAFRDMVCDVYYEDHPPFDGLGDRCDRIEVAARVTATYAVWCLYYSFFGVFNLFMAGYQVKIWGPRAGYICQILCPSFRLAAQYYGILVGGQTGISILELSQAIVVMGGPAGYIMIANTIAGELNEPIKRTLVFGRLQGCVMFSRAIGYCAGGIIGDIYGVERAYQVSCAIALVAAALARIWLPYMSPESLSDGQIPSTGIKAFFAPLRVLRPQVVRMMNGSRRRYFGAIYLVCGVFVGVVATGFVPDLLRLFGNIKYNFDLVQMGSVMSFYAITRAIFLLFIFPVIISRGRSWYSHRLATTRALVSGHSPQPDSVDGCESESEAWKTREINDASLFDLFFLKWSLVVDGALTALIPFSTTGWHLYLAAAILPLGSGTAPAAKGIITQMRPRSERVDALSAITLVENMGTLLTIGFFGFIFSAFAAAGKAELSFFVNGAVAVIALAVLLKANLPPRSSRLVEDVLNEEGDTCEISEGTDSC